MRTLAVLAALTLLTNQGIAAQQRATPTTVLRALLAEDWEFRLREYPEFATFLGDNRYGDRLTDLSREAIARRQAHDRAMLERVKAIRPTGLNPQDALSRELFLWEKTRDTNGQRFPGEVFAIDQLDGLQVGFPQLVAAMPYRNSRDYDAWLARLRGFPRYADQVIALLQNGIDRGWTQPPGPLSSIPAQIAPQLVTDAAASPLWEPATRFPEAVSVAERERIAAAARSAILQDVVPALTRLKTFMENEYLPKGRTNLAATSLPEGEAYYAWQIKRYTTLPLTAREIHELGLAEVKRIRIAMDSVIAVTGFKGSFAEFLQYLRSDPRFYHKSAEALLTGYRDISKRIDGRLPELFAELPRTPYGVRPFPDYEAPAQTTARYYPSAADGSRAGFFMANTYKLETRPIYEMEALTLHEAMPGHHLQIARAQELQGLPPFRRNGDYTAFVEGWGLYAESLGPALGLYTDPYSRFGQLTYEMWRACRLVIDTGIHAFGWTRQQAIDYMLANSAKSVQDVTVEVDRYIVWPGQALAYKLGELRIKALRAKAEAALGERFDIRRFHNALLDDGPLPLEVLERRMDAWIANEARKT